MRKPQFYSFVPKTTNSEANYLQKTLVGGFGHFNDNYDMCIPPLPMWHNYSREAALDGLCSKIHKTVPTFYIEPLQSKRKTQSAPLHVQAADLPRVSLSSTPAALMWVLAAGRTQCSTVAGSPSSLSKIACVAHGRPNPRPNIDGPAMAS